ncbi:TetR/AcrR family transcriptional regulator [Patulibacter sp.]|uniref:TetR/AcrR family transcriptional regulator n=1 Tax=Patulibacter sp. TaxID=1912859 RepID=UPI0027290153|nr:TetR/AcrR family transcriptional regulator [Patulibacter sp.]MDO9410304.1 TetR/AcrR family transcriptional regulator [Patulibacter sp.]
MSPGTPRTRLSHAERRTTILDAAARVIVAHGVHGFRLQDVADEAGVSQPLVSSHVDDRDELIAAAFVRVDERELRAVEADARGAEPGRAAIVRFLRRATIPSSGEAPEGELPGEDGWELWNQVSSRARFSPVVRDAVGSRQAAWIAALTGLLRDGLAGAHLPAAVDPERVALLLITVSDGLGPALNCGLLDDDGARAVLEDALDGALR